MKKSNEMKLDFTFIITSSKSNFNKGEIQKMEMFAPHEITDHQKILVLDMIKQWTAPLVEQLTEEHAVKERSRKKEIQLCPFSGNSYNGNIPRNICSLTGDAYRLGDCGSCRVAADAEMALD